MRTAQRQVTKAEWELKNTKAGFNKKWVTENRGLTTDNLVQYLNTGVWSHPVCTAASFLRYLEHSSVDAQHNLPVVNCHL